MYDHGIDIYVSFFKNNFGFQQLILTVQFSFPSVVETFSMQDDANTKKCLMMKTDMQNYISLVANKPQK